MPQGDSSGFSDELEARAADEQQREFLEQYLAGMDLPPESHVLEVGCGSGVVSRRVARWPHVAKVVGLDVSASMIDYAQGLSRNHENLEYLQGDALKLPLPANTYDLVLLHCVLGDVSDVSKALSEAFRVLKPGGVLQIFEADYASLSFACGTDDPLQSLASLSAGEASANPFLARQLSAWVRREGLVIAKERVFSYAGTANPQYLVDLFERGSQKSVEQGVIGPSLAEALKGELLRRVALGMFSGSLNYVSLLAHKPHADLAAGI